MNEVLESVTKLKHIFQKEETENQEDYEDYEDYEEWEENFREKQKMERLQAEREETLEQGWQLLQREKATISKNDFYTLFCSFVNLYFMEGFHLCIPNNAKKQKVEDKRTFFLATRNNYRFFHYAENEAELTGNMEYFLAEVEKLSDGQEEFALLKTLYLGIYYQAKDCFLSLSEKNLPIVDYYLFYMAIRDHIFAMEQRKNGEISKKEFTQSKKELCTCYLRFDKRNFSFSQAEKNNGSVETFAEKSGNVPQIPLPTIRFADVLCQKVLLCHDVLKDDYHTAEEKTKNIKTISEQLREILETQQMGIITEKGKKNQQDLFSNIPEIRMEYLMFPLKMDFDRNTFSLLLQNYLDYQELEERQKLLEKQQVEKADLLKEHAHNWGHMNFPKILSGVAKELNETGNVSQAQTLYRVYDDFLLLLNDLALLKLKYNSDSLAEFVLNFKKSLASASSELVAQEVATIADLLEDSLRITLFRMLFSKQEEKGADETFKLHHGKKQMELQESFSAQFLQKNQSPKTVIQWFNEELYTFEVVEMSSYWKKLGVIKGEVGYSFLQQIFLHLLSNSLNYGVKTEKGKIRFRFYQERIEGDPYLSFCVENPVDKESPFIESHGFGILGIKDSIARLNKTDDKDKFVKVDENANTFSVDMKIYAYNLLKNERESK